MGPSPDDATVPGSPGAEIGESKWRVLTSTYIGTVVEWFDFYIYGTASAIVFGTLFFPEFGPLVGTIASFGTLASGFLARPIGGIIWGHFGDRLGRKNMLVLSIVLMGIATTAVGALPTYAQAGLWAPILLVTLRIVQGLSAGGEWGGGVLMAVEHFSRHRRGLWGSIGMMGVPTGVTLATLVFAILAKMDKSAFLAWGWRIPFLAASVLVIIGLWMRLRVTETPAFKQAQQPDRGHADRPRVPLLEVLRRNPGNVVLGVVLVIGPFAASAVFITFALSYATGVGFQESTVLTGQTFANVIEILCIPLFGALSDRVGRRSTYMTGALLLAMSALLLFWSINTGTILWLMLGLIVTYICHGMMYGPMGAFLTELFSTGTRYTGISIGYQVAGALGGGFSPVIAASLLAAAGGPPHTMYVSLYMVGVCAVTGLGAYLAVERHRSPLPEVSTAAAPGEPAHAAAHVSREAG